MNLYNQDEDLAARNGEKRTPDPGRGETIDDDYEFAHHSSGLTEAPPQPPQTPQTPQTYDYPLEHGYVPPYRGGYPTEHPADPPVDSEYVDPAYDPAYDPGYDPAYDYEYERLRPVSSTRRRVLTVVLGALGVVATVAVLVLWWAHRQLDPPGRAGVEVRLTVPTGSSTGAIADLLDEKGVIANSAAFRYYTRFKGAGPFEAGDFVFRKNMAAWDAVKILGVGPLPPPYKQFTIPEGYTVAETIARIVRDVPVFAPERFEAALNSGAIRSRYQPGHARTLEGYLFPDTYRVEEGQDEKTVLAALINGFDRIADEVGLRDAEASVGYSPYDVLVVASLVQEEARIADDAPKVARVIYNRLDQRIPLGIDATFCYLKAEKPCRLTRSDLAQDTPYNTRKRAGLPPTPIANFGREALEAALDPADGSWLYYVLDADAKTSGGHYFTDDYGEFNRKKAECRQAGLGCG